MYAGDLVEPVVNDAELDVVLECILHSETAELPKFQTSGSACFDLKVDFEDLTKLIKCYDSWNEVTALSIDRDGELYVPGGYRVMIPTNVEFIIPEGYKVLIYPRSGLSLKSGINLANGVGVIDHDYHLPTFILIHNTSDYEVVIKNGDRIAQGELVPARYCSRLVQVERRIHTSTNRNGGMGSTGVN